MFERYTERARRAIFFARYEASVSGGTEVETHHLLLGVLRESHLVPREVAASIRREIEREFPSQGLISTAVDIPLSEDSKRALQLGAEAASAGGSQRAINSAHLLLGILALDKSFAAQRLRAAGFDHEVTAAMAAKPGIDQRHPIEPLSPLTARIMHLADLTGLQLRDPDEVIEVDGTQMSRRAALLGLVERAIAFYAGSTQPVREWPEAQARTVPWSDVLSIWSTTNTLIVHGLGWDADQARMDAAERYVSECERVMKMVSA